MTLYIPSGCCQVHFRWGLSGDPLPKSIAIAAEDTSATSAAEMLTFTQDVADAFETSFDLLDPTSITADWTYLGYAATYNWVGTLYGVEAPQNIVGTLAQQNLPPNTAYLVKKSTGLAGRANRGRVYVPPYEISEGTIDNSGYLSGAGQALRQASWNTFLAAVEAITPGNTTLQLLHTSTLVDPTPNSTTVTAVTVDGRVATQRRRLR